MGQLYEPIVLMRLSLNNMRNLKFKAHPTNAFFATLNQIFGGSSTAEHYFVVWTVLNDLISAIEL